MKVLFFDIDGTINHPGTYADRPPVDAGRPAPLYVPLDPACVVRLNQLVTQTGAVLVVSSSWRLYADHTVLGPALARGGVAGRVVGQTPDLIQDLGHVDALRLAWQLPSLTHLGFPWVTRGLEVQCWLHDHPEVEAFAVLDDQDDYDHLVDHLVQVDGATGLSDADVARAAQVLATPYVRRLPTLNQVTADAVLHGLRVDQARDVTSGDRTFRVTRTRHVGVHTGRPRYAVTCLTCDEVVHPATTGPVWNVEFHARDAQCIPRISRGQEAT